MKSKKTNVFVQVDETPEKKAYLYGSNLLTIGLILGLLNVVWVGMFLICGGGWLTWHSIHFQKALDLPKWIYYFFLFYPCVHNVERLVISY